MPNDLCQLEDKGYIVRRHGAHGLKSLQHIKFWNFVDETGIANFHFTRSGGASYRGDYYHRQLAPLQRKQTRKFLDELC